MLGRQYDQPVRIKSSYVFELAKAPLITNMVPDTKRSLRKCLVNEGLTECLLKVWITLSHKMVRAGIWDHLSEHTNFTNHNKIINKTQRKPLLKASLSQKRSPEVNSVNRSIASFKWIGLVGIINGGWVRDGAGSRRTESLSLSRLPGHLRQGRKNKAENYWQDSCNVSLPMHWFCLLTPR